MEPQTVKIPVRRKKSSFSLRPEMMEFTPSERVAAPLEELREETTGSNKLPSPPVSPAAGFITPQLQNCDFMAVMLHFFLFPLVLFFNYNKLCKWAFFPRPHTDTEWLCVCVLVRGEGGKMRPFIDFAYLTLLATFYPKCTSLCRKAQHCLRSLFGSSVRLVCLQQQLFDLLLDQGPGPTETGPASGPRSRGHERSRTVSLAASLLSTLTSMLAQRQWGLFTCTVTFGDAGGVGGWGVGRGDVLQCNTRLGVCHQPQFDTRTDSGVITPPCLARVRLRASVPRW